MEFEIKIKPLVLFDLEDKISRIEEQKRGAGRLFYESFLNQVAALPAHDCEAAPVYRSVKEYITNGPDCRLFYMIKDSTIFVVGLL